VPLCELLGCFGVRGVTLGKALLAILPDTIAGLPKTIPVKGGVTGGGQPGDGDPDMDKLMLAVNAYFGLSTTLTATYGPLSRRCRA
jgi:hypothetical protein